MRLFGDTDFDFMKWRRVAYLVSFILITIGVISVVIKGGPRYGIDFSGGTLVQIRFEKLISVDQIRKGLDEIKLGESVIQQYGSPNEFIIRLKSSRSDLEGVSKKIEDSFKQNPSLGKFEIRRVEMVGPQVGKDLQIQALYAVTLGLIGILIYTAFRFEFKAGVAAVIALIHDVLVTLGTFSLTNREISLPVLAAFLTIVGYSINDTIVVFDRIRENRGKVLKKGMTLASLTNVSVNQTLSRTVLTSLTVFLVVVVLYFFGGEVLHDFAFALIVGVITGTYSSIFVASPIVVDWESYSTLRSKKRKK